MQKTYHELHITPSSDYPLFVDVILSLSDEAIEEDGQTIILRSEENLDMVRFGVETFAQNLSEALNKPIDVTINRCVKENEARQFIRKLKYSNKEIYR